jgi:SAM-dependent methyltransferase
MENQDPEELASAGVHDKVFEVVSGLPGRLLLDAPTGQGALTRRFLESGKTVTAGDIDLGKFRLDREGTHPDLELVRLDLSAPDLPVGKGRYDIAVCVEGIEHLENQWNLVRNLNRALAPGGHLVLTTPNILNFRSRLRYLSEGRYEFFKRPLVVGRSTPHDLGTHHIAPVSYFELQFILESLGFAILSLHANKYSSRNIVSRALRPLFRLSYAYKNHRDRRRGRGEFLPLYDTILSDEIFYGETLILLARKTREC